MSKRKYRRPLHTAPTTNGLEIKPAPKMPHKPMSDAGLLDHLEVIRVVSAFPDTLMSAIQIRDLVVMESNGRERNSSVNQSLHHLCKIVVREGLDPVHGHHSRLDDYEEFINLLKAGVFYRTSTGNFVLDTSASWRGEWHRNARGVQVRRVRLIGNRWPHFPYKGESRIIPANKAKPADVPPAEKVVESVLDEIDNPVPTTSLFDAIQEEAAKTKAAGKATITIIEDPELDEYIPTPEAVGTDGLPERDDEFTPSPAVAAVNGVNPEPQVDSGFELLSMPTTIIGGSELVLRIGNEIIIAEVSKRYPLAGRS